MTSFLVLCNAAADAATKPELSGQEQADFMQAWATWAQAHAPAPPT